MKTIIAALVTSSLLFTADVRAQDAPKPEIMIVAMGHLANPGRDAINIAVDDVMTPSRQAEIAALIEKLAAFKPTHVAIEARSSLQDKVDGLYRDYRAGKHSLGRGEAEQIGARLASRMGLERLHAVDWNDMPPGSADEYDWVAAAKAAGQQAQLDQVLDPARLPIPHLTPGVAMQDWLLQWNRPETLAALHNNYYGIAALGDPGKQQGAAWVGTWYARNLRIFNHLKATANQPGQRLLLVYGAGHGHLLRQFVQESGAFTLVEVESVLRN